MKRQKGLTRREFLLAAAVGTGGVLLAACAPQPTPTPPPKKVEEKATAPIKEKPTGKIVVWMPWQERGEQMVAMFNEAGTGVEATWELGEYDTNQKLFAVLAAGTPPDCGYLGRWQHPDLAVRNAIFCLDDWVESSNTFTWDNLWDRLAVDSLVWGKKWCVPFTTDTRAFMYNKRLMREAGLDPEKPPTTFDELLEASKTVTKRDEGGRLDQIGFTPSFGNPPVHLWFYTMMWCQDFNINSKPGLEKCQAATPQGERSMKIIKEILDAEGGYEEAIAFTKALTPGEGLDAFSAEKVVFALNGNWVFKRYDEYAPDLEMGMIPGPVIPEFGIHANYDGGGGWYIFKAGRSKNPEAAWDFCDWWMDPEPYLAICDEHHWMPARKDVTESWAKADERRRIFASTAGTCGWIDLYVGRKEEGQFVAEMFQNILILGNPIMDELEICQKKIQALLDRHHSYPVPS